MHGCSFACTGMVRSGEHDTIAFYCWLFLPAILEEDGFFCSHQILGLLAWGTIFISEKLI
jgi:hypothetical protein